MSVQTFCLSASIACVSMFFVAGCRDTASTIAEKTITAAKETSKGLDEGADKGRKAAESADGAVIVSSAADLAGKGEVTIYAVHTADSSTESEIVLAVENTTDKPLRITRFEVVALDKEGFVKKPTSALREVTVAPKAKEKVSFFVSGKSQELAKVRVWDRDLAIGDTVRK